MLENQLQWIPPACSPFAFKKELYPDARLSLLAWSACILSIAGALIRIWSHRSLGKCFTWEVTILPDHTLYTSGPYSAVRHPGYTGAIMTLIGNVIFSLARGTYLRECVGRSYPTTFQIGRILFGVYASIGCTTMLNRSVKEDRVLQRAFGQEWERWAARTQYRLLPGIF